MASRVTVILNNTAGIGNHAERREALASALRECALHADIIIPENGRDITRIAREVMTTSDAVIAAGGDGTINAVASALVNSNVALGIVPLGTFNHFARDLHIPDSLEEACRSFQDGRIARVDVGEVNGQIFLNNSSIGVYPRLVREREHEQRRGWGKLGGTLVAAAMVLYHYPRLTVRLESNTTAITRVTPFVFVGNNLYESEGLSLGRRHAIDRGQLSVYVAREASRWAIFRIAVSAVAKRLRQTGDIDMFSTTAVTIETRARHLRVSTDGEVRLLEAPLHYRIRPAALRVIVPRQQARQAA